MRRLRLAELEPFRARQRARYFVARGLGLDSRAARHVSDQCERFAALLVAHGRDPRDYGDLAVRLEGGRPRTNPEYQARYQELRRRGLSSTLASALSKKRGRFELTIKKLDQGIEVFA